MFVSKDSILKAVIFDLDGVILNSMPSHTAAWQAAFAEAGFTVEADYIYRNEGNLNWELLRTSPVFDGRISRPEEFERISSRQREIYLSIQVHEVQVYPRAAELVDRLWALGIELAVVTSSRRQVIPPELRDWLEARFSHVITRDQVSRSKPHPEPYLAALKALNLDPTRVVVVENAPAGIQAAKQAGLFCLALTTTLPQACLTQADLVLSGHEALTQWLKERLGS